MWIFHKVHIIQLRNMSQKVVYPASERNKCYILEVLKKYLDTSKPGNVLEISSGTGQHISYFAPHFPHLTFQPSEIDQNLLSSIVAYSSEVTTNNIRKPLIIDASSDYKTWNLHVTEFDYLININMIQVSPFKCTLGLFRNASKVLKPGGFMITYGPYAFNGVIEPQSNIDFDKELRTKNTEWGIRDLKHLKEIAKDNNIKLVKLHNLPANNKSAIWQKNE